MTQLLYEIRLPMYTVMHGKLHGAAAKQTLLQHVCHSWGKFALVGFNLRRRQMFNFSCIKTTRRHCLRLVR